MSICPNCGAETRPGDSFCLSCGSRLAASPPPSSATGDATLVGGPPPASNSSWSDANEPTVLGQDIEEATLRANPVPSKIENPARLVLPANKGAGPKEYLLEKLEITIGRAPENDIVLPDEEKVISRYHATIHYESGSYSLSDNGSSNGTFVNGQQLEKTSPRMLHDGDRVGIGDYELVFYAPASVENEATLHGSLSELNFDTVAVQGKEEHEGVPALALQGDSEGATEQPPPPPETIAAAPESAGAAPAQPTQFNEAGKEPPVPDLAQSAPAPGQPESPAAGISIRRFTNLSQPLPDITTLIDAAVMLNGQASSLQQQLNAAREAKSNYEDEISETANQLRAEMSRISTSMNNAISGMSNSRAEVDLDNLVQLVQEVMSNPRDIDNARAFAGRAADVSKIIQRHEDALKTLNECRKQLRSLIGED